VQPNVVNVDPAQVAAPHVVPAAYFAHWPAPSQTPLVPQLDGGIIGQPASAAPALTAWQVPSDPGNAQVLQVPQLAATQQNPSVQLPLKHSAPARQAAPLAFRFVQTFDMQVKPDAQSPSPPHIVRHDEAPHA
jgi:hypothetical protein